MDNPSRNVRHATQASVKMQRASQKKPTALKKDKGKKMKSEFTASYPFPFTPDHFPVP
jgi:hypothetical protein